jgi:hypothetical protein
VVASSAQTGSLTGAQTAGFMLNTEHLRRIDRDRFEPVFKAQTLLWSHHVTIDILPVTGDQALCSGTAGAIGKSARLKNLFPNHFTPRPSSTHILAAH